MLRGYLFPIVLWPVLVLAAEPRLDRIPGEVCGDIAYVPGKYGLAAALRARRVGGRRMGGISYPIGPAEFPARAGTFACWIKAASYHCVTVFTASPNYKLGMWHLKHAAEDGTPWFSYTPFLFFHNHGDYRYNGVTGPRIFPDYWYHVCITWDRRDGRVRSYVNAHRTERHSFKVPLELPAEIRPRLHIGASPTPEGGKRGSPSFRGIFNGHLDDVIILSRPLPFEEVKRLFFSGPFVPDEDTVLWLNFDERSADGVGIALGEMKP